MTRVAVVIPGIMGSVLKLNDEVIWPGPVGSLVFAYKKMEQLLKSELIATDIIRTFSVSSQYETLIDDLKVWGFTEGKNLHVCPYDWRKANEDSARVLADKIDAAHASDATAEITLVAHSMGGLISRYYLESGKFTGRPGYSAVRALITLGTPHRGAPLALTAARGMEKRLFLSKEQVHELVKDERYPAVYQLMPSPGEPFAWDETAGKELSPLDVYDAATAKALGLVAKNVEAARSFRAALDQGKRPTNVRYFYFGGTRQTTTAYVHVRMATAEKVFKMDVEDAGDGTVPVWSSGLGAAVQWQPVGGEHGTIYKNDGLRRTLARLLGYVGVLAAEDTERVEVAVRERVTEPEQLVHVALTFSSTVSRVKGRLRLERATIDETGKVTAFTPYGAAFPITYEGMNMETLSVSFDAPDGRGIYKVVFESAGGARLGEDEMFVQEP
jgi:pimeloyl-ACP methyl ester carboxylesterase